MIRRLFSHTVIYGAAPHVSKFASFFVLPIVTKYLTALDYGVYGVVTATVGAISVLSTLGLRVVLVNSFYKSPTHYVWLWRQVYGFLSIWVLPYAIACGMIVYFVIPDTANDNIWSILALNIIPVVAFGPASSLATTYYQINKRPIPIAIRTAFFGIFTVFLNWFTIAKLGMGYMGWFWSSFVATTLLNLTYWIPLNFVLKLGPIFNFKWRLIKESLKVSLPTVPHYYAGYLLNTSDRLIMEFLRVDTISIGLYNVAYTFGNYFSNLGNASGLAIGPLLNECYKVGNELRARTLVFLHQTTFLVLSFTIAIWLKELFLFFIRNSELNGMYYLGVIVIMAYNYRPMYLGAAGRLFYYELTSVLWRVSFIAGIGNVVLNLLLIPIFGFQSAAFTTFASLMYMGYSGFFLRVFRENSKVKYYPLGWFLLTIGLTILAYYLVEFDWQVKIWFSVVFVGVAVMALLKLRRSVNDKERGS